MELLAGVALFLIFILLIIGILIAIGVFTLLYKLLEKLVNYDVKTGLNSTQELPSMDRYTPQETDNTVPLDQFVPRPNVKVVRKESEEDKITPLEN